MVNPNNKTQFNRLIAAVRYHDNELKPFRQNAEKLFEFEGNYYGQGGAEFEVPVNFINMYVSILTRQLTARAPRVMIKARTRHLQPTAWKLQHAVTDHLREIKFGVTQRRMAKAAILSGMGIGKVGWVRHERAIASRDREGDTFADNISGDDFIYDTSAMRWEGIGFAANRYLLPLDIARESTHFNAKARSQLQGQSTAVPGVDAPDDDRLSDTSKEWKLGGEDYDDFVELMDIWLPRERLFLTVPGRGQPTLLSAVEWDGPEMGPYHILSYLDVPDNIQPIAPAGLLRDLHNILNTIFSKAAEQADQQKTVYCGPGSSAADAERIAHAKDNEFIMCQNPDAIRDIKVGGVDGGLLAFFLQGKDLVSWFGGNLDALGGLGAQAETATQEQLMVSSASRQVADMQDRTIECVKGMVTALGWYEYDESFQSRPLRLPYPGGDGTLFTEFGPEERKADFFEYEFDVAPYSTEHTTPAHELQKIANVFQTFVVPHAQQMAAQGVQINYPALLRKVGELADIQIEDMLLFMHGETGNPAEANRPAQTQHTNVRRNIPGATRNGKDMALAELMRGGNMQPAEMAGAARGVG